jgi:protein-tyrosine phosphatase
MKNKVTFVCTGNICRSPLAEGILRAITDKFIATSSGIEGYHSGEKPDYRALKVAKKYGVAMDGILSKQLTEQDLEDNDHVFVMTQKHKERILRHTKNQFAEKIHVLLEFCEIENEWDNDIKDPYYGTDEDFEEVFKIIQECAKKLLEKL